MLRARSHSEQIGTGHAIAARCTLLAGPGETIEGRDDSRLVEAGSGKRLGELC
jgi:hypothetical protein